MSGWRRAFRCRVPEPHLAASGNLREAIDNLRVAVVNAPESVEAHFDLGEALAASGAFDPAMEELETALRLNPNHAHAHIDLGRLLSGKGLRDQAVTDSMARR
jgi:tetratricopeptide (TPR) repeat protein